MLKSFLNKVKSKQAGLKLKFDKHDKTWMVLKGHSIMFIGHKEQCKTYMSQFG